MSCAIKGRSATILLGTLVLLAVASTSLADPDPCLVVYPYETCTYHYDTSEYYTVTAGHPLYDPLYDRGGEVLIELNSGDIAWDVYQAPNLAGFEPSTGGNDGYFMIGNDLELIVDGWSNAPTTYVNILLVFDAYPGGCTPIITVDGNPVLMDPQLGQYFPIGDLVVSTPTGDGTHYSDTVTHMIHWELCSGVHVWAFADEDYDLYHDGGECFTAFSHDLTIPVRSTTWSSIKAIYGNGE
jgi:hypothetical protein